MRSLNNFAPLHRLLVKARCRLWRLGGVDIDRRARPSLATRFRPGARGSITVGAYTKIAFRALIYTRDDRTGAVRPVRIGACCFIGGGSIITPGVTIGDGAIVGAGAVVFEDVPPRAAVGGNPARVLRRDIPTGRWGRLSGADENSRRMWNAD